MDYIEIPENKLRIEFDLRRNFSLKETASALEAIDKLFRRYAIQHLKGKDPRRKIKQEELGLYITTINSGSLTADLIQAAPFLVGVLPNLYDLSLYTNYIETLQFLLNRFEDIGLNKAPPTAEIARTDAECISKLTKVFANKATAGSLKAGAFRREVNMSADGTYHAVTEVVFGAEKMVSAYNGAEIAKLFLENHKHKEFNNEVMTIHQINESFDGEKGDEIIISSLSSKPLKVTFASIEGEYLKSNLVNDPSNPLKQKFMASGLVSLDQDGRPASYHLTAVKKAT